VVCEGEGGVYRVGSCPGGGALPYMGYKGMYSPKRYGFSAVLVINRALILAILAIRLWFLHSSLDMGMFLRRSHFFINIEKNISKNPSQSIFTAI